MDAPQDSWEGLAGRRGRFQFRLRTLLLVSFGIAALFALGMTLWRECFDPLRCYRKFQRTIASADRVVVQGMFVRAGDGAFDRATLFEVTRPESIDELRGHLRFVPGEFGSCFCCGYPGIDWYRGQTRVARTSVQHGVALRWEGFPQDAALTPDSSRRIVRWLAGYGVYVSPFDQLAADKKAAASLIVRLLPAGFKEGVALGQKESLQHAWDTDLSAQESEGELKDRYVRGRCPDRPALFATLLRVMSVAPESWEALVAGEQEEAVGFLTRAPRGELDVALRRAANSHDRAMCQGAARVVFTQQGLTLYGKTDRDVDRWMGLLAPAGYAQSRPANRLLVLKRLADHPHAEAIAVLAEAVEDPDRSIRRQAIAALQIRGSPAAIAVLRRVASGQTSPRKLDPGEEGVLSEASPYDADATDAEHPAETDRQAAEQALGALAR